MADLRKIEIIRERLLEIRALAIAEKADMLTYLIGMAITETEDIASGRRPTESGAVSDAIRVGTVH
jgi:hypothetical protein